MDTVQEVISCPFDCREFLKQCRIEKVEIYKERQLLSASIQMPRVVNVNEYDQMTAYFQTQIREMIPDLPKTMSVRVVPEYAPQELAHVLAQADVLWKLLGVSNLHVFLKIEEMPGDDEKAVLIRCSNDIAYRTKIDGNGFSHACESLLAKMCHQSVKVYTRFEEDDSLEEVPDDYFGPSKEWEKIRSEQCQVAKPSQPRPSRPSAPSGGASANIFP